MKDMFFDIAGVGAGPFNLSVAALLHPMKNVRHRFFERQKNYAWHPGMLLPNTTIQNSFLKDLVSFVDPTNPFSFLSFLHAKKRLYEYVNAGFPRTSRMEFNQYLQWVASQLPSIQLGKNVETINRHDAGFQIITNDGSCIARNIIVGTGPSPAIPSMAENLVGDRVFHSSRYLFNRDNLSHKRVAVIGGGQSGAEIVLDMINRGVPPSEVHWISARHGILPLDESHFANEWFTPAYIEYFHGLASSKKAELLEQHRLSSDGVSPETIEALYQTIYRLRFLENGPSCRVMHSRVVDSIRPVQGDFALDITHMDTEQTEMVAVDCIVLATGYKQTPLPAVLENISDNIEFSEGAPAVNLDFSLRYSGPGKVFVINAARTSHGVAEPNLSVNAWRASMIINSALGHEHYVSPQSDSVLDLSRDVYLTEAA